MIGKGKDEKMGNENSHHHKEIVFFRPLRVIAKECTLNYNSALNDFILKIGEKEWRHC